MKKKKDYWSHYYIASFNQRMAILWFRDFIFTVGFFLTYRNFWTRRVHLCLSRPDGIRFRFNYSQIFRRLRISSRVYSLSCENRKMRLKAVVCTVRQNCHYFLTGTVFIIKVKQIRVANSYLPWLSFLKLPSAINVAWAPKATDINM